MYTSTPGINVVWNVLPKSTLAYKILRILVICNDSAVGRTEVKYVLNNLIFCVSSNQLEQM